MEILTDNAGGKWRKGVREADSNSALLPAPFARNLDHVASISGFESLCVLRDDRGAHFARNHAGRMVCRIFPA